MPSSPDPIVAVSQRVERFLQAQRDAAGEFGEEALSFVESGASAATGGKGFRAKFCLAGWRAVATAGGSGSGSIPEVVTAASAALEIFHAAALVHDDVIDRSDTRRGRPASHRAWESQHGSRGWAGDGAEFGRSAAILLGDLLVAWSDDLLEEGLAETDAERAQRARSEFARMRREVTIGQFLDVAEESAYVAAPVETHPDRALRVASLKSARYSVQHPLQLGAALADADAEQYRALGAFGHPVGLAFQLRDDVLGVFGDSAVTGKPVGDDLREGKRTLLIAYARAALSPGALRVFDELVGDRELTADQVSHLQQTIIDTGALARVEERITEWATEADRALRGARLDHAAVSELRELARAATVRTA
ncbi:polyprenyl synthetase family protein [Microbacterium oleivorans]|uniref:Polyprenyl synthetase n=1 Tax=Microbacterium oleivorans TaxID=273677 RepID=A0A031G0L7_9MICO|nr:polyprenyl synthetase family protein [Microbacterium oleivorans]EZP29450.1 Polyprenyl synthetase [Microbacterium oleivorans]THE08782.1 polyprenyl synthetase family protein [Microbacterium oleivorans]